MRRLETWSKLSSRERSRQQRSFFKRATKSLAEGNKELERSKSDVKKILKVVVTDLKILK